MGPGSGPSGEANLQLLDLNEQASNVLRYLALNETRRDPPLLAEVASNDQASHVAEFRWLTFFL
jgi:hypothetical protein